MADTLVIMCCGVVDVVALWLWFVGRYSHDFASSLNRTVHVKHQTSDGTMTKLLTRPNPIWQFAWQLTAYKATISFIQVRNLLRSRLWLPAVNNVCHSLLSSAVLLSATYFPFIRSLSMFILFIPRVAFPVTVRSIISCGNSPSCKHLILPCTEYSYYRSPCYADNENIWRYSVCQKCHISV